jgi:hypothetical protein
MRHRVIRMFTAALLLVLAGLAGAAEAAGPWRATIVDAETGQPLEGAVVVAAFTKYSHHLAGTAGGEYYGSDEVVTGPDGRFEIPARNLWNPIRIFTEVRMELTVVKPGYGRFRLRTTQEQKEALMKLSLSKLSVWPSLEEDNAVLEMPPLKTREARLQYYDTMGWTVDHLVPRGLIPRFLEAERQERAYLGLSH